MRKHLVAAYAAGLLAVLAPVAHASGAPLAVHVQGESPSSYSIEVDLTPEAVALERTVANGMSFTHLVLPSSVARAPAGTPQLPVLHRLLAVQPGQRYEVHVSLEGRTTINDVLLAPAQPDVPDTGGPRPLVYDARAYQLDHELGAETVTLGRTVKLGPVTFLPVNITPVHYNPARHRLTLWRRVTAYVYADGATGQLNPANTTLTPFQASQVAALADNAKAVERSFAVVAQPRILILTSADLQAKAQELATNGHYTGLTVDVQTVAAGATSQNVKDQITASYAKGDLSYVLFFGDETRIPTYAWLPASGQGPATASDSWYAMMGTDSYLSLGLGRFPVRNTDEATTVIGKLAKYDQLQHSGFINRTTLLVANSEDYPQKYTANQEAVRMAANPLGLKYVTEYGGAGATNQNLVDAINKGAGLITYRGHGDQLTWFSWDASGANFGAAQITPLVNYDQGLAVIFSIACDTGALQTGTTSMAETWLLDTSAGGNASHGAVAVIASTDASFTDANDSFNSYLFTALQNTPAINLGTLYTQATNTLIRDTTGTLATDEAANVKMYVLFGDPVLRPWVD